MGLSIADRFSAYVDELAGVIGDPRRARPLRDYCTGLVLPGTRKSVEPMAACTEADPERMPAHHQALLHFVGNGTWSDEKVLSKVQDLVVPEMTRREPIQVWIIDDTGLPKQGKHSVGVKPQYCGQIGKQTNCQVTVTLSIANHEASLPVAYRLYLPQEWAEDEARREKAGVPAKIRFQSKPQIALDHIRRACLAGVARGVVLMDLDYGRDARLRAEITALGLTYMAGIKPNMLMWPPGAVVRRPDKPLNNTGRRDEPDLMPANEVALALPKRRWRRISWREGSAGRMTSRFARVRVRVPSKQVAPEAIAEEWLLIEWPEGEAAPTKYWLSTMPAKVSFRRLVDTAKLRWRIERDYHDLKQEFGLGHYEGRGWRGFHHHATLCIAAYGFLIAERAAIPPSGPCFPMLGQAPALPDGYRPRGSAIAASAPR